MIWGLAIVALIVITAFSLNVWLGLLVSVVTLGIARMIWLEAHPTIPQSKPSPAEIALQKKDANVGWALLGGVALFHAGLAAYVYLFNGR